MAVILSLVLQPKPTYWPGHILEINKMSQIHRDSLLYLCCIVCFHLRHQTLKDRQKRKLCCLNALLWLIIFWITAVHIIFFRCWLDYANSDLYKSFYYPAFFVLTCLTFVKSKVYFEEWKAAGVEDQQTKNLKYFGTMIQKQLWKSKPPDRLIYKEH